MRQGALVALAAIATLHVALADGGQSYHERQVDRVIASPGPLAGLAILSDRAIFRAELEPGIAVQVDADGTASAPFYLRYHLASAPPMGSTLPSAHQSILLEGPGAWYVEIDPAAGADVHVRATFRGFVGDPDGGAPAAFELGDVAFERACLEPGACLP